MYTKSSSVHIITCTKFYYSIDLLLVTKRRDIKTFEQSLKWLYVVTRKHFSHLNKICYETSITLLEITRVSFHWQFGVTITIAQRSATPLTEAWAQYALTGSLEEAEKEVFLHSHTGSIKLCLCLPACLPAWILDPVSLCPFARFFNIVR